MYHTCEAPRTPTARNTVRSTDPTRPTARGVLTLADNPTVKLDYPNPVSVNLKICAENLYYSLIKSADGIVNHINLKLAENWIPLIV